MISLVACAPNPVDVVVVVPAHDESHCIGRAIEAIARSSRRAVDLSVDVTVQVVVVDDASTDATSAVASAALLANGLSGVVIRVCAGSASMARRAGIEAAASTPIDPTTCWVLSTDADSEVPADWIERYLAHARAGAIAVAGVVDLLDDPDAAGFVDRWRTDYGATLRADGRHPHVHAANLGVRLDAYLLVDGFADVGRAEDIDLWRRLREVGVEPIADASIVVATSGRREGRVERGFAHALALAYPATADPVGGPGADGPVVLPGR